MRDDGSKEKGVPPSSRAQMRREQFHTIGSVVADDGDEVVLEGRMSGDWIRLKRNGGSEWFEVVG